MDTRLLDDINTTHVYSGSRCYDNKDQVASNFWQGSVQKHDFQPSVQIWEIFTKLWTNNYNKGMQKEVIRK